MKTKDITLSFTQSELSTLRELLPFVDILIKEKIKRHSLYGFDVSEYIKLSEFCLNLYLRVCDNE